MKNFSVLIRSHSPSLHFSRCTAPFLASTYFKVGLFYIHPSIHLFVSLSNPYIPVCLPVCPLTFIPTNHSIYLSICVSACFAHSSLFPFFLFSILQCLSMLMFCFELPIITLCQSFCLSLSLSFSIPTSTFPSPYLSVSASFEL